MFKATILTKTFKYLHIRLFEVGSIMASNYINELILKSCINIYYNFL